MNQTTKQQGTVVRLFSQLKGQRVRLTIVLLSIIWNPMFSAQVIDHLWQSIQAAWKDGTPFAIS